MKISVIMPVYNGEKFIVTNVTKVRELLESYQGVNLITDFEIVVVDDGSKDNTLRLIKESFSQDKRIVIVQNIINQGKGFALKNGFFSSSGDIVVLIDSDLDIPPEQIKNLITEYKKGYDIVISSKFEKGSELKYPILRRIISFIYYITIKILFGLPIRDTQTGLKLFKREVLELCLSRMVVKRFAFDLELLLIAHRYNFTIKTVPVKINYHSSGFVSPSVLLMSFIDTISIFYRAKILQFYDRPITIPKSYPYKFFILSEQKLIGINTNDKDVNEISDDEFVIIKNYKINKNLDLGVLASIIESYKIGVINGSISYSENDIMSYISSNIIFSHLLMPLYNIAVRVVNTRLIPMPISDFLCVDGKTFKYLLSEKVNLSDIKDITLKLKKKYNFFVFSSDWSTISNEKLELVEDYFLSLSLLIRTGNISGLVFRGVLFFSLWFTLALSIATNNIWLALPYISFYLLYLIFKLILSGLKGLVLLPFFLIFSLIIGLIGTLSPIFYLLYKGDN
jgi:glycosyltransferase involved in cell wall biosynthesis